MSDLVIKIILELIVLSLIFYIIYYFLKKRIINQTRIGLKNNLEAFTQETKNKYLKNTLAPLTRDIVVNYNELLKIFKENIEEFKKFPKIYEELINLFEIKDK